MAYVQADVANMALARLGARAIATMGDNSVEARSCNRLFNVARDMMLAAADWSFATARAPLVATATLAVNVPFPYTYEYALPPMCIKTRYLVPPTIAADAYALGNDDRVPYETGVAMIGGVLTAVIWTTISPATIVYTYQVVDPGLWDPGFVSAFSVQLASEVALPVTGNGQVATAMRQAAADAVTLLKPWGLNEGTHGRGGDGSEQIAARN